VTGSKIAIIFLRFLPLPLLYFAIIYSKSETGHTTLTKNSFVFFPSFSHALLYPIFMVVVPSFIASKLNHSIPELPI
jgi:uncharacterized RDD family membrane protein YckC